MLMPMNKSGNVMMTALINYIFTLTVRQENAGNISQVRLSHLFD